MAGGPGRRAMWRAALAAALAAASVIGALSAGAPAGAQAEAVEAPQPSQWPASDAASPRIEGVANGVRYWGADRHQTALALALGLRGGGGYPFDSPDRSSGGAASLAAARGWWGVGRCPRAVIVVAADSPADALAASALSDPTGRSREPYLQRTSAADPLFDPVGGFARVDTDLAPVLLTGSARSGATALTTATRIAAADLRAGGCTTARQAIVVGGPSAVPETVERELVSIGYQEVFRVWGADRFATAAEVAASLGTAGIPTGTAACVDPVVSDGAARMGFYANSVIEVRDSPTSCRLQGRAVVLADGVTGADALAAGWWTSFWQVPVLLHDGTGSLPAPTARALQTLGVDTIVVLGGTVRIPAAVADEAAAAAGAQVVRLAGPDRYATSVEVARRLGGWWPTGRGLEYAGSLVCLAASSGDGATARGWPDALAAGAWCGAANRAAGGARAPERVLSPVAGAAAASVVGGTEPGHDAVPVLLVPAEAAAVPEPVAELLRGAFPPGDGWCSARSAAVGCLPPGFVVAVGGPSAVSQQALDQASTLVAGGVDGGGSAVAPRLADSFYTELDLAPVFDALGAGPGWVCAGRGAYGAARWLAVFADPAASRFLAATDLVTRSRYLVDADGVARTPGTGSPACLSFTAPSTGTPSLRAVGPSGSATAAVAFSPAPAHRFTLGGAIDDAGPEAAAGIDSTLDPPEGGTTTATFVAPDPMGGTAVSRGEGSAISSAAVSLTLVRGTDAGPDTFTATWTVATPQGTVGGVARGEALRVGQTWRFRGRSQVTGGSWNAAAGVGGFRADLSTGVPGFSDDVVSWQVDALVTG